MLASLTIGLFSLTNLTGITVGALSSESSYEASCEIALFEDAPAKLKGQREYFLSFAVVESALEQAKGERPSQAETHAALSRMTVRNLEHPGHFVFTYADASPRAAIRYLHAHIATFRAQMFEHRVGLLQARLDRLSKRLDSLNVQKERIETAYWERVPFHDLPVPIKQIILDRLNAARVEASIIDEITQTVTWPPRYRKERLELIIATRLNREEIESVWGDYIRLMRQIGTERQQARLSMSIVREPTLSTWSKLRALF